MVQIVRPGDFTIQGNANISENVAARAGEGRIRIGQAVAQAGRDFQQQGKEQAALGRQVAAIADQFAKSFFKTSPTRRAGQSALLTNKTNEATEEFVNQQIERYKHETDENGNPTYGALATDIETLGTGIKDRIADTITDPEVKERFINRFTNYVAGQKISAIKEAAKQEVKYGLSTLDTGLGKLIQTASRDNIDQLGVYEQQGLELLEDAFSGGLINYEDYQTNKNQFSNTIREAALSNAVQNNKEEADTILQQSPETLGISAEKHSELRETLRVGNEADKIAAKKAEETQQIDNVTNEANLVEATESRIQADNIREDELLGLKGKVAPAKFSQLKKQFLKQADSRAKLFEQRRRLALKIANGDNVVNEKPSHINDLFQYMVNKRKDETGQDVSLSDQAMFASSIPAPVKQFAGKLEHQVKYGKSSNAQDILSAYTYIKDRGKSTLESSFDDKARLIMKQTEFLVERGGYDAPEALIKARESVFDVDSDKRQLRESEFRKEVQFKDINIEETAASSLKGAESFFGANRISQSAIRDFKELVKQGYIENGDIEVAKAFAADKMQESHGVTNVGNAEEYMFAPPEKYFPDISSADLTSILKQDVAPILPEGVDLDSLRIASDSNTIGQIQITGTQNGETITQNVPTWTVTYEKDVDGQRVRVPVLNPETGQLKRWTPAGTKFFEERQQQQIQGAKEQRLQFIEQLERDKNAPKLIEEVRTLDRTIPHITDNPRVHSVIESASNAKSHFDLAKAFLGASEHTKQGQNVLTSFFKAAVGTPIRPERTPWCAVFANSVLEASGLKGTGSAAARSFLNWGKPTNNPQEGDIVVFSRGNSPTSGHVGFYAGTTKTGNIRVLGGNQGDKVSIQTYSKRRLLGYRKVPKADEIKRRAGEL